MTAPPHLMLLIDDDFARAIGRDMIREAIQHNAIGGTSLYAAANSEFLIAEGATPSNIFGLLWRMTQVDNALCDEDAPRYLAVQLLDIALRDAALLAEAEYQRLLADAKSEGADPFRAAVEAREQSNQAMIDLAIARGYVDFSPEEEQRVIENFQSVLEANPPTTTAGLLAAVDFLAENFLTGHPNADRIVDKIRNALRPAAPLQSEHFPFWKELPRGQDPMAMAAKEYLDARAAYAAAEGPDCADDGPVGTRYDAACDAIISGPRTTGLAGALLAADVIAADDSFACLVSEAAFRSLHEWLRRQASTSAFEQGKRDQVEGLKTKAKAKPGRKGRAAA